MTDTLFVYVDGNDLEECYARVTPQLRALAAEWQLKDCRFVDDRYPTTPDLEAGDLPDWNLGVNLPLAALGPIEAERLVELCHTLALERVMNFEVGTRHFQA